MNKGTPYTGKFEVGQRVRLRDFVCPSFDRSRAPRYGVVLEQRPQNGGYLVRHSRGHIYGWMEYELECYIPWWKRLFGKKPK